MLRRRCWSAGCRAGGDGSCRRRRAGFARRTRGCGSRTRGCLSGMRSGTPSWTGCGLTWRFCSGCCSGGRRSGRVRGRLAVMTLAATGTAGRAGNAAGALAGSWGAGGAAGLLAPARFEVAWQSPETVETSDMWILNGLKAPRARGAGPWPARACRPRGPQRSPGSRPARRAVASAMRSSLEAGGAAPYHARCTRS